MNTILLSFLCGAAFIGGAVAMTVLVVLANSVKTKSDREEVREHLRAALESRSTQIAVLKRIAAAIEQHKARP